MLPPNARDGQQLDYLLFFLVKFKNGEKIHEINACDSEELLREKIELLL